MEEMKILELFSGIGGMHSAFKASGAHGCVVAAVDINTVANAVYSHNYPNVEVYNNNIQKFTPKFILNLNVNTILMSPPCQPFTRVGNQKDIDDTRTDALLHICQILDKLENVHNILMENVKGFETSKARDMFINSLEKANYHYQEFILSPSQIGVPNTRHRYYCLARKSKQFSFKKDCVLEDLPNQENLNCNHPNISKYIQENDVEIYLLPDKVLEKRAWLLDIACPESTNTICFTKAYTHYTEGTGSVFCSYTKEMVETVFAKSKLLEASESVELLKTLKLRYFTPMEVAKLMCFPERFLFPKKITNRQKYRLLGNSINVYLVSELIKLLVS